MEKRNIKYGDRFGRLVILKYLSKDNKHQFWSVKCDCGNYKTIRKGDLFRKIGATISCGCARKTNLRVHGLGHTRLNNIWNGILTRIRNSKSSGYKYYGGEKITICDEWLKFDNFIKDMKPSYDIHVQKYGEKNTTIDRKKSNKSYSKNNCRWATYAEQNNNKRSNIKYKGETATQASYRLTNGRNQWLVFSRLRRGWNKKKAFTKDVEN